MSGRHHERFVQLGEADENGRRTIFMLKLGLIQGWALGIYNARTHNLVLSERLSNKRRTQLAEDVNFFLANEKGK